LADVYTVARAASAAAGAGPDDIQLKCTMRCADSDAVVRADADEGEGDDAEVDAVQRGTRLLADAGRMCCGDRVANAVISSRLCFTCLLEHEVRTTLISVWPCGLQVEPS
jgi:hypothetical protein